MAATTGREPNLFGELQAVPDYQTEGEARARRLEEARAEVERLESLVGDLEGELEWAETSLHEGQGRLAKARGELARLKAGGP